MFSDAINVLSDAGRILKKNKVVVEGIGYAQAKDGVAPHMERVLRRELTYDAVTNNRIPKNFHYVGYRTMSPLEIYAWRLKDSRPNGRNARTRGVDISRTNTNMIELIFRVDVDEQVNNGKPYIEVRAPMFVPYFRRGSITSIRGTEYHGQAVYHTPGLCFVDDGLFVDFAFSRKVKFKDGKKQIPILADGRPIIMRMPCTDNLYGGKMKNAGSRLIDTPMCIWNYARHGFRGAIKRYTGVDVMLVTHEQAAQLDPNLYAIIQSNNPKNKNFIRYCVAVPKECLPSLKERSVSSLAELNLLTYISGLFAVAGFFATNHKQAELPFIVNGDVEDDVTAEIERLNSPEMWQIILGMCILGVTGARDEIYQRITRHLEEIPRYITEYYIGELQSVDPDVPDDIDIFDFIDYAQSKLVERRNRSTTEIASLYNKRLTLVDYLMLGRDGFTVAVSGLRWALENIAANHTEAELYTGPVVNEIKQQISRNIKYHKMQRLETSHGELTTFSCATESMIIGVSTNAIDQTKTTKQKGSGHTTVKLDDPRNQTHASYFEVCSNFAIPKSKPQGYGILNDYVQLTPSFIIKPKEHLKETIRKLDEDLCQRGGH